MHRAAVSTILNLSIALTLGTAPARAQQAQIPLVPGLTVTDVVRGPEGDHEVIMSFAAVTPSTITVVWQADLPVPDRPGMTHHVAVSRMVRTADLQSAHRMNVIFASDDPTVFVGSTIDLSRAMYTELTTAGTTSVIYGDVPTHSLIATIPLLGAARKYYRGSLTMVGRSRLSVLVNGVPTPLRAIEVRGHLTVGDDSKDVDTFYLDQADFPLFLGGRNEAGSGQVTEIAWDEPGAHAAAATEAAALGGKACRAEVHGIFFAFGSAELVPASDAALQQVATMLKQNPSWVVTVTGHTDSVGSHAANLDLSTRRAAAVRDALVNRYGVAAARLRSAGRGDSAPLEPNTTIAGRARNRRVELTRAC